MSEGPPGSPELADVTAPTATAVPTSEGPGPSSPETPPTDAKGGEERGKGKGFLAFMRELPVLVIMAFVLALLIKSLLVQAFYIPSGSMEPTLLPGDRVLVNKVVYHFHEPRRGDIVVFENPNPGAEPHRNWISGFLHWLGSGMGFARPADEDFIKRVIGLPRETIELRDGNLYVNGRLVRQPYLRGPKDTRPYGPITVPPGKLLVLGDNRLNSNDSRFGLGFVPIDKVVGKAFVKIWPPSRIGWLR